MCTKQLRNQKKKKRNQKLVVGKGGENQKEILMRNKYMRGRGSVVTRQRIRCTSIQHHTTLFPVFSFSFVLFLCKYNDKEIDYIGLLLCFALLSSDLGASPLASEVLMILSRFTELRNIPHGTSPTSIQSPSLSS